jgi:uncharacterized protein YidB (DUF937 family)
MFEQLMNLVKEHSGEQIINNAAIPNEHNEEAVSSVATSIFSVLQTQVANGNVNTLLQMFQGNNQQNTDGTVVNAQNNQGNPIMNSMIASVVGNFATKFGMNEQTATGIANSLLPTIMENFVNKTNDEKDSSFNLQGILAAVSGDNKLDIGGLIGSFFGGNKDNQPK